MEGVLIVQPGDCEVTSNKTYVVVLTGKYSTHPSGISIHRVEAPSPRDAVTAMLPNYKKWDSESDRFGEVFLYEDVMLMDFIEFRKGMDLKGPRKGLDKV